MQFHLTKMQLFSPFAFYTLPSSASTSAAASTLAPLLDRSRRVGRASAIHIAKLFATFRRKYDIRCLQSSGVQYAETAARFLVRDLPRLLPPDQVVEPEAHLRSLARTLEAMVPTFRPAVQPLAEARAALAALEERSTAAVGAAAAATTQSGRMGRPGTGVSVVPGVPGMPSQSPLFDDAVSVSPSIARFYASPSGPDALEQPVPLAHLDDVGAEDDRAKHARMSHLFEEELDGLGSQPLFLYY